MSKFLECLKVEIEKRNANVFRIAEMKGDSEIEVIDLVETNACQDIYSVAKAFTVTAVGMLCDRGLLSPDEIVTNILSDECPVDCKSIWRKTTVDMLMRHQVGLAEGFLDIDACDSNTFGDDYLSYTLTAPICESGEPRYCYTDAAFYILSRIVAKRAGMTMDDFLRKNLFAPLGCREVAWSHCPMGHAMGATGLYIRVEDMVKLGALYRDGGVWRGKRILSEEWTETVISRGYELCGIAGGKAYGKGGMKGQFLIVIPGESRVCAWQSFDERYIHDIINFVAKYRD